MPAVRCEEALGFYWINLDSDAEPLSVFLKDMLPIMEHYEFGNLTLVQDQTVSINCNWKAVLDNFATLPRYYLQHRQFVDCTESLSECYEGDHTRVWVPAPPPTRCSQHQTSHRSFNHATEAFGLDRIRGQGR